MWLKNVLQFVIRLGGGWIKNEKLKHERTKSEAMNELEMERKNSADEEKERLASQEREQLSRLVATEGKLSNSKKRNKAGK